MMKTATIYHTLQEAANAANNASNEVFVYRVDKFLCEEKVPDESFWFVSEIENVEMSPFDLAPFPIASNWKVVYEEFAR